MRRSVLAAGLAALGALATLCATMPDRDGFRHRSSGLRPVVPGTAYAVNVDRDQAELDLEFQPNTRYFVVISSLARSTGSFTIAASSRPIIAAEFVPPRLAPLQSTVATADSMPIAEPRAAASLVTAPRKAAPTPRSAVQLQSPLQPPSDAKSHLGAPRSFALHVTDGSLDDPNQYAQVAAHEVARGRNVRVYLDDQQSTKELAPGLVQSIANLFDDELISRFRGVFGTCRDIDGDGRFSVLLSPWLAHLQGGRTSIGGFVRGSDFQLQIAPPFSNRCDMMYVNSQSVPGPHLRTLLIHEYTHAVSFSQRSGGQPGQTAFPEEEDWLNEALAHCAETLFDGGWTNLDYRISRYLNDTAAYPLVVEDYYRAGLWRCHGCRGATYLFLRYCVERFGTQMLTRLIAAPARGPRNLELATGCTFDRLFRDWTLSLLEGSGLLANTGVAKWSQTDAARPSQTPDSGDSSSGQLASLDLCGALGPWGLAGPRPRHWDLDSGPLTVELKGTSAAFVELSASRQPGVHRIHLAGPQGTQLQVSLVRMQDDSPEVEVDAAWSQRTSAARDSVLRTAAGRPLDDILRIVVRIARGEDAAIEEIAAEQNDEEDRIPLRFCGDAVKSVEVAASRPLSAQAEAAQGIPAGPSQCRVFELPGLQFSSTACPVIIKVVVVDRHGRRTSGWATVRERAPKQIAAIAAARH